MSHDPEAVDIAFQALWDQMIANGQVDRVCIETAFDALAAAGYTVTRQRWEPATVQDGSVVTLAGEPLYRKIEGSTDGDDR